MLDHAYQAALDEALGMEAIDEGTGGEWRIFSKLGAGYSSSRSRGEIVTAGYTCIPRYGDEGGVEFSIAARASVPDDTLLVGAQARLHAAVSSAVAAVASGLVA